MLYRLAQDLSTLSSILFVAIIVLAGFAPTEVLAKVVVVVVVHLPVRRLAHRLVHLESLHRRKAHLRRKAHIHRAIHQAGHLQATTRTSSIRVRTHALTRIRASAVVAPLPFFFYWLLRFCFPRFAYKVSFEEWRCRWNYYWSRYVLFNTTTRPWGLNNGSIYDLVARFFLIFLLLSWACSCCKGCGERKSKRNNVRPLTHRELNMWTAGRIIVLRMLLQLILKCGEESEGKESSDYARVGTSEEERVGLAFACLLPCPFRCSDMLWCFVKGEEGDGKKVIDTFYCWIWRFIFWSIQDGQREYVPSGHEPKLTRPEELSKRRLNL